MGAEALCTGTWAVVPAGGGGSQLGRQGITGPLTAGSVGRMDTALRSRAQSSWAGPPCGRRQVASPVLTLPSSHEAFGGVPAARVGASPSTAARPCPLPPAPHFPLPLAGPSPFPPRVPFSRRLPSPPPRSCWEWRLHFSCHLHSQSIRTPQLSRLAALGGRRRRERVLWGLSPPHRSHSAPDCFLLRRAQPAGRGGSGNPRSSFSLRGTHGGRRDGARGRPGGPALALRPSGRQVRSAGRGVGGGPRGQLRPLPTPSRRCSHARPPANELITPPPPREAPRTESGQERGSLPVTPGPLPRGGSASLRESVLPVCGGD